MNSATAMRLGTSRKVSFAHGAAHTIDIQFLFTDWHGGPLGILHQLTPQERALSKQLVAAWTNFMYTGNPNLKGDRALATLHSRIAGLPVAERAAPLDDHRGAVPLPPTSATFWDTVLIY